MTNYLYCGDNLKWLEDQEDSQYNLIYIDPPFNTGIARVMDRVAITQANEGDKGFQGKTYAKRLLSSFKYVDAFDDFMEFIAPRLYHARRILSDHGTIYVHLDYREVHYVKVFMDYLFGRDRFLNEIVWAYDYGGRGKRSWPKKHDTILVYTKTNDYIFNWESIERIPYMAPGLVTKEKAERGKVPTDVWWNTIVPTNGTERTGYPTQKPLAIVKRIVQASSLQTDTVVDFFAGSGTTAIAAYELERMFIALDSNPDAITVMRQRFDSKGIQYEYASVVE